MANSELRREMMDFLKVEEDVVRMMSSTYKRR
jgi:hypothetical protein